MYIYLIMDSDNNKPGYITANPKNYLLIKEIRDSLKNNPTQAEKLLWLYLKNKKTGYKRNFTGNYIF